MPTNPTIIHHTSFVIFATLLTITACAPTNPQATVALKTTAGEEVSMTISSGALLSLNPVTTRKGGATMLDLAIETVAAVAQQGKLKVMKIDLRSGEQVSGRIAGNIEGITPQGPRAIAWKDVASADFQWNEPPPVYTNPPGNWAEIAGEGIEEIEVHSVRIQEGWVVRHGTHAYRQDLQETELLPFLIPREKMVLAEWDIPVSILKKITVFPKYSEVLFTLDSGKEMKLEGSIGTALRKYEGSASFLGANETGNWTLSLLKMRRAILQSDKDKTGRGARPNITIEFFGQAAPAGNITLPEFIGTCTSWNGDEFPILELWLEEMTLEKDGAEQKINPADVKQIRVHENPWTEYDEQRFSEQMLASEVHLKDGTILTGSLGDQYGYISCFGPGGAVVHLPSYNIRRLELTQ